MTWTAAIVRPTARYRPWSSPAAQTDLTIKVARGQYAAVQVCCIADGEDVTGVNVFATTPVGLEAPTIQKEVQYDVKYRSRGDAELGEWPFGLIPKVDQFYGEIRSAFPFDVYRTSSQRIGSGYPLAYPVYTFGSMASAWPVVGVNTALLNPEIRGAFTGLTNRTYGLRIVAAGGRGTATFQWNRDGGSYSGALSIPSDGGPVAIEDGITIWWPDQTYGVHATYGGDKWEFMAGPKRVETVQVKWRVPQALAAGTYSALITVSASGKADLFLTLSIDVRDVTIPLTSSIPISYKAHDDNMDWGHWGLDKYHNAEAMTLRKRYIESALRSRVSLRHLGPWMSYNPITHAIGSWTEWRDFWKPYMDGTWSDGSKLSILEPRLVPSDLCNVIDQSTVKRYHLTTDELGFLAGLTPLWQAESGWISRGYFLTVEEPSESGLPSDWYDAAQNVAAEIRSVGPWPIMVTKTYLAGLVGACDVWTPVINYWKDHLIAEYPSGARVLGYTSCMSKGCDGTGGSALYDLPTDSFDHEHTFSKHSVMWMNWDAGQAGDFYYAAIAPHSYFTTAHSPHWDPWDELTAATGPGEGCYFLPGRPTKIGGTTHIPCETLNLDAIRQGAEDWEIFHQADLAGMGSSVHTRIKMVFGMRVGRIYSPVAPATFDAARDAIMDLFGGGTPARPKRVVLKRV
jgi:hypothetical protein